MVFGHRMLMKEVFDNCGERCRESEFGERVFFSGFYFCVRSCPFDYL